MVWTIHHLASSSTHLETTPHLFRAKHLQKTSTKALLMRSQSTSSFRKNLLILLTGIFLGKPKFLPLFLSSPPTLPAISHSWSRTISESDHWRTFRAKSTENICIVEQNLNNPQKNSDQICSHNTRDTQLLFIHSIFKSSLS